MSMCASMKQRACQQSVWVGLGGKILVMLISTPNGRECSGQRKEPVWPQLGSSACCRQGHTWSHHLCPGNPFVWSAPRHGCGQFPLPPAGWVCRLCCPLDFKSAKLRSSMYTWTLLRQWGSPAAIALEPLGTSTCFLSNATSILSSTLHDSPLSMSVLSFFNGDKPRFLEGKQVDEGYITSGLQSKNLMSLVAMA